MTKTRYKFLRTGYKSDSGKHKWVVGKWYTYHGKPQLCERGFHCSRGIYQAFYYVHGEILAEVEVAGEHQTQNDKEAWQKMRIVRSWKWTKKDSVLLYAYAARLVLKNFERVFPDDKRPREAIEAAERYAKNPTKSNRIAARIAAESAWDAAEFAWYAAESTENTVSTVSTVRIAAIAAIAARSAARIAAAIAGSAAIAARSADISRKLDKWMKSHLQELKLLQDKR